MYSKSKKQQRAASGQAKPEPDFLQSEDSLLHLFSIENSEETEVTKLLKNLQNSPKKQKKKSKMQNLEKTDIPPKTPHHISQDSDIMNDSDLLGGFEGTEIQKAFLYSEIFKNTKN